MHSQMNMIRCAIVRGGTSKGIFIMENEQPKEQKERDRVLLSIFGSPDIRQIDGLGGADVLTSKLAIIAPGDGIDGLPVTDGMDGPGEADHQGLPHRQPGRPLQAVVQHHLGHGHAVGQGDAVDALAGRYHMDDHAGSLRSG